MKSKAIARFADKPTHNEFRLTSDSRTLRPTLARRPAGDEGVDVCCEWTSGDLTHRKTGMAHLWNNGTKGMFLVMAPAPGGRVDRNMIAQSDVAAITFGVVGRPARRAL